MSRTNGQATSLTNVGFQICIYKGDSMTTGWGFKAASTSPCQYSWQFVFKYLQALGTHVLTIERACAAQ